MRLAKALLCAVTLFALAAAGVRADDYNKLTYFTFSAPVQVPGATLPAGTYMFKLANPESGRRSIQIWDQEGKKLHTTLLSMSDERMDVPKEPIVMFGEAPSGEPPAVRSWFYEGDRIGYEFAYPKDQAMKIARAAHTAVLADLNSKPARIDETGQVADESASSSSSPATASSTPATTDNASASVSSPATSDAGTPVAASTTDTATAAPQPSGNRSESTVPTARTDADMPVGTSGSASDARVATSTAQAPAPASSAAAQQPAPRSTDPAPQQTAARELPRTASALPMFEVLSGISLLSALGVRRLRRRFAEIR